MGLLLRGQLPLKHPSIHQTDALPFGESFLFFLDGMGSGGNIRALSFPLLPLLQLLLLDETVGKVL